MAREIVIVGGSSAGLFTAYHLALAGAKVELFEQAADLEIAPRKALS